MPKNLNELKDICYHLLKYEYLSPPVLSSMGRKIFRNISAEWKGQFSFAPAIERLV